MVGESIKLYWQKVSGAIGYNVYSGTTSGSYHSTPVNDDSLITSTSYTVANPSDGNNYYIVKPVLSSGLEGSGSDEIVIYYDIEDVVDYSTELSSAISGNDVVLSWDEVSNAYGYYIYTSNVSGSYSNIPLTDFPVTDTTFTHANPNAGINYYIIKPVYSDNSIGKQSNEIYVEEIESTLSIVLYVGNNIMTVNGEEQYIDSSEPHLTAPELNSELGRVFVPISSIINVLGGEVSWDGDEQKVTIDYNGNEIEMWIDSTEMTLNSESIIMDAAPYVQAEYDRTMLPIRFIVEYLGLKVEWKGVNQSIIITD